MIQEYLFQLDSRAAAQVVTLIGGLAALVHYFFPRRSANKWGLQANDPIVLWFVERTALVNIQTAFACFLMFFYNVGALDAVNSVFVSWALDSLYTALFTTIPGGNNAMHKRGYWINFALGSTTIALKYLDHFLRNNLAKFAMGWVLFNGLIFSLLPRYGLYQLGLPCDKKGYYEALLRIHGGSLMQLAAFAFLMLIGMDAKQALSRAMMLQFLQIFFSQYVLHEGEKLGFDREARSFWILLYIPAISSLWV